MNNREIFKLVKNQNSTELELALKNGLITNINLAESGMKTTLLMTAACLEIIDNVKLLLEYGADPNIQDIYGKTVLHLLPEQQPIDNGSIQNKVIIAEMLLKNGADLTIIDQYEGQPLWYAVFYVKKPEDMQLVGTYLKYGADPNYKNNGQSALDFAKKIGYKPLIEILQNGDKENKL